MRRFAVGSRLLVALAIVACVVVGVVAAPRFAPAPQVRAATYHAPVASAQLLDPFPPSWAADATVPGVEIFSAPGQSTGKSLTETPEGEPLVFLVKGQRPGWVEVQLPERPNQALGWVKASDVHLRLVTLRIVVSLGQHTVTLYDRGRTVLSTPSVIGAPASPTPTGSFYVTSVIHLTNTGGAYGVGAFGLAAFSNVYETFGGGPGQVGIHGTNQPQLVGQSVSHGCVRIPNDVWTRLSSQVVPGTPVLIQA
jgi:lipoprotein-anchoring transpeptidase ErfK/SrfK